MFSSVVALASNDVWAVGESIDGSLNETTLTEHWDGSSWTVVDSPNPDPRRDIFVDVSAIPGTDRLWAVGGAGDNTLVELWTGSKWKVVSSPSGGSGSFFNGVSAAASGDAWATGGTGDDQYLTARWNGVAWNFAQQPPFGSRIAAFADGTALAAGHRFARWDGSAWLPLGRAHGRTSDIAATPQQGWAVGTTGPIGMTRTWSARWDGSAWKTTSSPNAPGEDADVLFSVAQTPGSTEAWAVGFAYHVWHHNNFDRPLILHHC
jgi:hypothetical protein